MIRGLALASVLVFSSCASREPWGAETEFESSHSSSLYEWNGDGLTGAVKIVINLSTQRADIFVGGQHAGWTMVATGREGFGTPVGSYRIVEKVADKHSTLYGKTVDADGNTVNPNADIRKDRPPIGGQFLNAPMPYWMRLTWTGIGMHAGPIPQPGSPASHGCIRLPDPMAERLFYMVKIGTPVEIVR